SGKAINAKIESRPQESRKLSQQKQRAFVQGFILGVLAWVTLGELGFGVLFGVTTGYFPLIAGVIGALVNRTRARGILWGISALPVFFFFVVSYPRVADHLIQPLWFAARIEPAPAVVVLASDIHRNGELNAAAQARFFRAYELLRQGKAK